MEIQAWVDDLHIEVPEAPEPTLARAVRNSFQEFCRISEVWRHSEVIAAVEGANSYGLTLPVGAKIYAADWATFKPEGTATKAPLDSVLLERLNRTVERDPHEFAVDYTAGTVEVEGVGTAGEIEVAVILTPAHTNTNIPDEIATRYFEAIRSGALMRLLTMANVGWADPRAAQVHASIYERTSLHAKRLARGDRSRPKRTIRYGGIPW